MMRNYLVVPIQKANGNFSAYWPDLTGRVAARAPGKKWKAIPVMPFACIEKG